MISSTGQLSPRGLVKFTPVVMVVPTSRQIGRDKDLGTLEVGKLADLVVLSADLFFLAQIEAIDPSEHKDL